MDIYILKYFLLLTAYYYRTDFFQTKISIFYLAYRFFPDKTISMVDLLFLFSKKKTTYSLLFFTFCFWRTNMGYSDLKVYGMWIGEDVTTRHLGSDATIVTSCRTENLSTLIRLETFFQQDKCYLAQILSPTRDLSEGKYFHINLT